MPRANHAVVASAIALSGCYGLDAGSHYPDYSSGDVRERLLSPEHEDGPSVSLSNVVVKDEVCEGVDTHTMTKTIAQDDLARFLEETGQPPVEVKARGNLYWYDFPGSDPDDGDVVRLRLAVLSTPEEAADELHKSLLQHGPGWWGLRRGNVSVLAPKAGLAEALAFALKHKLVCWGMMSYTDLDDVYVIPGPYMEL